MNSELGNIIEGAAGRPIVRIKGLLSDKNFNVYTIIPSVLCGDITSQFTAGSSFKSANSSAVGNPMEGISLAKFNK